MKTYYSASGNWQPQARHWSDDVAVAPDWDLCGQKGFDIIEVVIVCLYQAFTCWGLATWCNSVCLRSFIFKASVMQQNHMPCFVMEFRTYWKTCVWFKNMSANNSQLDVSNYKCDRSDKKNGKCENIPSWVADWPYFKKKSYWILLFKKTSSSKKPRNPIRLPYYIASWQVLRSRLSIPPLAKVNKLFSIKMQVTDNELRRRVLMSSIKPLINGNHQAAQWVKIFKTEKNYRNTTSQVNWGMW